MAYTADDFLSEFKPEAPKGASPAPKAETKQYGADSFLAEFGEQSQAPANSDGATWAGLKRGVGQTIADVNKTIRSTAKPSYMTDAEWEAKQTGAVKAVDAQAQQIVDNNTRQYEPYSADWW